MPSPTINVCSLDFPAKCTRAQIHYGVPFAESKECRECPMRFKAEISLIAKNQLQPTMSK